MALALKTETDILEATARSLEEKGYDVFFDPASPLLPPELRALRPDGIATGREPKLVIEIAQESASDAQRIANIQRILRSFPEWKLHLVVGFASQAADLPQINAADISAVVDRAALLAQDETQAALLMAWAAMEAVARARMPEAFSKPQSPGRIIEIMAAEGSIAPSDAAFLREMAAKRNAFLHGGLKQRVATSEIQTFLTIVRNLITQPDE